MDIKTLLETVFTKNRYKGKRVFILSWDTDKQLLATWKEALDRAGASVKSQFDVQGGEQINLAVRTMMRRAQVILVLFDRNTARRGTRSNFHYFLKYAQEEQELLIPDALKLIPIRLDARALQEGYELAWLDCWNEEAPDLLSRALQKAIKNR